MRAFRVAYDGTPYAGFQRQPSATTVEGTIFDALRRLGVFEGEKPPGYAAAGRTDAGVSAVEQTVALEAPDWLTPRALNSELPASIRAWAMAEAPADFHARHDAVEREYTYHLYAPEANDARAHVAAGALAGEHDFHNLTPDDEATVRDVSIDVERDGAYLVLTVRSRGFARQLVRRLVSLIHAVSTDDVPIERIERALSSAPLPGHLGVPASAPEPLVLTGVEYPRIDWRVDERAASNAHDVFAGLSVERRTGARVADTIARDVGTIVEGVGTIARDVGANDRDVDE